MATCSRSAASSWMPGPRTAPRSRRTRARWSARPGANTAILPEGAGPGGPPPDISPPSGLPGAITSSWAVKAVIMARKRPLPKYAGALAEPIYVDTVSGELMRG